MLFFVAHRAVEQRVFAALQAAGFEATSAQGRLSARIPDDGIRLTQLAESAQVTKQTAGFLVDQVEAAITDEWTEHLGSRDMAKLRAMMLQLREITDPYR